MFRAFCICGKEVNSVNQVTILKKFFNKMKDEDEGEKYLI